MEKHHVFLCEDRIVAVVAFSASILYGVGARRISGLTSDDVVGPAGLPSLIAVAGMGLSVWLFIKPDTGDHRPPLGGRLWLYWLGFAAFVLLMPILGFGVSCFLFLAAVFVFLGTKVTKGVALAAILSIVFWLIFAKGLDVQLTLWNWI